MVASLGDTTLHLEAPLSCSERVQHREGHREGCESSLDHFAGTSASSHLNKSDVIGLADCIAQLLQVLQLPLWHAKGGSQSPAAAHYSPSCGSSLPSVILRHL